MSDKNEDVVNSCNFATNKTFIIGENIHIGSISNYQSTNTKNITNKNSTTQSDNSHNTPTISVEECKELLEAYIKKQKFREGLKDVGLGVTITCSIAGVSLGLDFGFGAIPFGEIISATTKIADWFHSVSGFIPFASSMSFLVYGLIETIIAFYKKIKYKYSTDKKLNSKLFWDEIKSIWISNGSGFLGAALTTVAIGLLFTGIITSIWHVLIGCAVAAMVGFWCKHIAKKWWNGDIELKPIWEAIEDFEVGNDVCKGVFNRETIDEERKNMIKRANRGIIDDDRRKARILEIQTHYQFLIAYLAKKDECPELERKVKEYVRRKDKNCIIL